MDKTYSANTTSVVDEALRPLLAFKEILFGMEAHETTDPPNYACVIESLVNDARRKLVAMQSPLEAKVGCISFLRATATNPDAETDEIVDVEVRSHA